MTYSIDKDPNRTLTFILYILYIVAIFSAGLLAIVALLINYLKLDSVKGSIFDSHFRFQIRTFWWYLAWTVIAFVPFVFVLFAGQDAALFATVTLAATIFCVSVLVLSWLWIVYRAIKGIIRLNDNRAI